MKKALITGITGQDGSYLAELLLEKGYEVHGIVRRASVSTTSRIDHIIDKLHIHEGDLSDSTSIVRAVKDACGEDFPVSLRYSVVSKTKDFRKGALPGETYTEAGREDPECDGATVTGKRAGNAASAQCTKP